MATENCDFFIFLKKKQNSRSMKFKNQTID